MRRKPGTPDDALEITDRMIGDDAEMRRMLVEKNSGFKSPNWSTTPAGPSA